ncbi:hypothetical protein [Streptomyces sp. NPDC050535]|uniref:hypothetical protein n=1 Tax=Streptomyces sp. NPDC050535 TaxID=3365626 RepID=UPI0037AFCE0D
MPSRTLLALAGWTAAATAATLTGLAAVHVIGDGITASTDGGVLTPRQVEQQLAAAKASTSAAPGRQPSSTAPTDLPTTTPAPSTTVVKKTFSTPGGTVIAQCDGTTVRLLSWAPAQGYGVESVDRGPDERAEVKFEGAAGKVEIRVRCVNGEPAGSWEQDD